MTKTSFQKVIDFMNAFGQKVYQTEQPEILQNDTKLTTLRVGLIKEEDKETIEALLNNDFVELVDGLGDIEYVTNGTGSAFGINLDKEFDIVYQMHMIDAGNKVEQTENQLTNFQKYVNYMITQGKQMPEQNGSENNLILKNEIKEEIIKKIKYNETQLEYAVDMNDFQKFTDSLVNILFGIYETAFIFGIDLDKAFDIIHCSNMTKLCKTEEEAIKTVEWYKDPASLQSRYKEPTFRKSDDDQYWIVFDKSNGKILKSINYTAANLTCFLNKVTL